MLKLGDGTAESHERAQNAVDDLWRYTGELFLSDRVEEALVEQGIAANPAAFESTWRAQVTDVLTRATLRVPDVGWMQRGGRQGRHTEHLGHMLADMQIVARSFPGASW